MTSSPSDADKGTSGQEQKVRALVEIGAEATGGAVGGILGFLLAGPAGAAAAGIGGVAVAKSLAAVGSEICDRVLSPREKVRVGTALIVATARTQERLESGERARTDNFVDDGSDRPPIEEVTEGLMLAAQRAYDEKKVPFIGRLSANLNFRPDLDVQAASVLVRAADELSFQQICLLRLLWENERGIALSGGKYNERLKSTAQSALLYDLLELERAGYANNGGNAVLGLTDIDPPKMRLQVMGVHLFDLMELGRITAADLAPIRRALDSPEPVVQNVGGYAQARSPFSTPIVLSKDQ